MFEKHQVLAATGIACLLLGLLRCNLSTERVAERRRGSSSPTVCGARPLAPDLEALKSQDLDQLVRATLEETGIQVAFAPCSRRMLQFYQNYHYVPLEAETDRVLALLHLRQALRAYGPDVLPQVLDRVVVVKKLWLWDDHRISGFARSSENLIYTTLEGLRRFDTFHHEVGHLLDHGWFAEIWRGDWTQANPVGWEYPYSNGWDEAKFNGRRSADPLGLGFVSSYGSTDVAEDFAEYFALQMSCPASLEALAGKHERIAAKREVLLDFVDWLGVSAEAVPAGGD